jgi:hypothetical protein
MSGRLDVHDSNIARISILASWPAEFGIMILDPFTA